MTVRQAICPHCREMRPSDPSLAFFEDRSEGSASALDQCAECGYSTRAPQHGDPSIPLRPHIKSTHHTFVPSKGRDTDLFYCGCRGWD